MNLQGIEKVRNIRSLARFHFIGGLPRSGVSVLTALLNQNPRFVAGNHGPAAPVFGKMVELLSKSGPETDLLDDAQKIALWRGVIDAVYHDRPFDSAVFDANRDWLEHTDILVRLFPLSRFIIMVRNPAAIVNSIELSGPLEGDEETLSNTAAKLMAPEGEVGLEIAKLRDALTSRHAERMFVLDYDRLADDPEEVMDVLYDFLREPVFTHDFDEIGSEGSTVSGPVERSDQPMVLPTRMILQLSGRAFWRNLKRTSATMMLGRAR